MMRNNFLIVFAALAACTRTVATTPASPTAPRVQLFLLAGQSNMAGRGVVEPQDRVADPHVTMLTRDSIWVPATDPVHFDKTVAGVGPGRAFALTLAQRDTTLRIGLVPAAVGGSPIASWQPGALDAATKTHPYDDAIARARVAMRSGTFVAILWHQGESDGTAEKSAVYADQLRAVIARFRRDLGNPNLPFIIGQLGQFERGPWSPYRARVDSAQRLIAATVPHVAFVSSSGLRDKGDTTHFDSASARELGRRYATAFLTLTVQAH